MLNTLLYILVTLAFLAFFGLSVVKSMHMFQLNSYKPPTHMRWMRLNKHCMIPGTVGAAVTALLLVLGPGEVVTLPVLTAVFALLAATQRPRKAKKPLVYTMRVKRMLVTIAVLLIAGGVIAGFLGKIAYLAVVALLALLSPVVVLIANTINKPIEKMINQRYINDAKRILKNCPKLLKLGVTGSYGKTSVKYILSTLLQAEYDVLKTPESYNTPMGVVKTVRNFLRATHEVFVCEMGARHVGDIQELCDIVHPQYGVITSVGPQHLETFFNIENVKKTKFELADALPESGIIFLNGEDANIRDYMHHVKCGIVTYGLSDRCDYYATDISASSRGTTFTVHTPEGDCETFTAQMVGAHNVINIVGAIAVCCKLGIPVQKLRGQVRKLESVPHRLQLIRRNGVTIIDDAYNANPTGSKAAIDALALFDGYKILVTPGMVELGEKQDELNKAFGAYAAGVCDYVALVGKKQTQSIYEGLIEAGYPSERIFVGDQLGEALTKVYAIPTGGKERVILLENDLPDNF